MRIIKERKKVGFYRNCKIRGEEVKNKQSHFGGGGEARSAVMYIILREKQANN